MIKIRVEDHDVSLQSRGRSGKCFDQTFCPEEMESGGGWAVGGGTAVCRGRGSRGLVVLGPSGGVSALPPSANTLAKLFSFSFTASFFSVKTFFKFGFRKKVI